MWAVVRPQIQYNRVAFVGDWAPPYVYLDDVTFAPPLSGSTCGVNPTPLFVIVTFFVVFCNSGVAILAALRRSVSRRQMSRR